jgi:tRNA A37 methylthiotransferase MiaB
VRSDVLHDPSRCVVAGMPERRGVVLSQSCGLLASARRSHFSAATTMGNKKPPDAKMVAGGGLTKQKHSIQWWFGG